MTKKPFQWDNIGTGMLVSDQGWVRIYYCMLFMVSNHKDRIKWSDNLHWQKQEKNTIILF